MTGVGLQMVLAMIELADDVRDEVRDDLSVRLTSSCVMRHHV
jgi:hypothetical protein